MNSTVRFNGTPMCCLLTYLLALSSLFFLSASGQDDSQSQNPVSGPGSINPEVVTTCQELQSALGSSTQDAVIVVMANLRCDSGAWQKTVLVVKNKTVRGSGQEDVVGAIDWGDSDQVVIVASGAALTFQDIILVQDFLGNEGLGLPFLGAEFKANAYLQSVAVGVRVCPRPVTIYDSILQNLTRPESIPGQQHAFRLEPSGLFVRDVAFAPLFSNSTWRLCNTLFRCGPKSALDTALLNDFRTVASQPGCEELFDASAALASSSNLVTAMAAGIPTNGSSSDSGSDGDSASTVYVIVGSVLLALVILMGVVVIAVVYFKAKQDRKQSAAINQMIEVKHGDKVVADPRTYESGVNSRKGGQVPCSQGCSTIESASSSALSVDMYNIDLVDIELGPCLGKGRRGSVYKCKYYGNPLAVKVVDHSGENLMEETGEPLEAYLRKQMRHVNLVETFLYKTIRFEDLYGNTHNAWSLQSKQSIMQTGTSSDTFAYLEPPGSRPDGRRSFRSFIVMEYCNGGPLSWAIQDGAFFSNTAGPHYIRALMTALDIARGMAFLHAASIVHGNLHPENVLVKSEPKNEKGFVCKVGGFASSKYIMKGGYVKTTDLGSRAYLAPELLNDGLLTGAADVYAYGVLLWRLLAAVEPFQNMRDQAITAVVLSGQRPGIPRHFPGGYAEVVQHCWRTDRAARPTFQILVKRLSDLISYATGSSGGPHSSVYRSLAKPSVHEEGPMTPDNKGMTPRRGLNWATEQSFTATSSQMEVMNPKPRAPQGGSRGSRGSQGSGGSRR